ncbi:hypothetical protein [Pleionea litopenaei]|uniref:Uncharacterized protein n=1 Tax=Pleionea litopenaei TaxID=3070815 RepID=A0AA51RUZ3_9GAMM|nr:hypothetical protein [Pleionea sp. HL-JVS1]WMS88010.1 hypothetical protein Q9312_03615 [Pleionea sp. HL-JVS1]
MDSKETSQKQNEPRNDAHLTERIFGDGPRQLLTHPGLILSSTYFIWALIGLTYLVMYYSHFNISILKYLEVTDILIAGLQEPKVSIAVFGALAVIIAIVKAAMWSTRYQQEKGKNFSPWMRVVFFVFFYVPKNRTALRLSLLVSLILYFAVFLELLLADEVNQIKSSANNFVQVKQEQQWIRGQCEASQIASWKLLGTTTKFVFLYNVDCDSTQVLPIESIQSIANVPNTNENLTEETQQ